MAQDFMAVGRGVFGRGRPDFTTTKLKNMKKG